MLFQHDESYILVLRNSIGELDFLLPLWLSSELPLPNKILLCPSNRKQDVEDYFTFFFGKPPEIQTYGADLDFKQVDPLERKSRKIAFHLRFTLRALLILLVKCWRKNVIVGWDTRLSNKALKFAKKTFFIPTSIDATRQRFEIFHAAALEKRLNSNVGPLLNYIELSDETALNLEKIGFKLNPIHLPDISKNPAVNGPNGESIPKIFIVLSAFNSLVDEQARLALFDEYVSDIIDSSLEVRSRIQEVVIFPHPRTTDALMKMLIGKLCDKYGEFNFTVERGLIVQKFTSHDFKNGIVIGGPTGARAWFEILSIPYFVYVPERVLELNNRIAMYRDKYEAMTKYPKGTRDPEKLTEYFESIFAT